MRSAPILSDSSTGIPILSLEAVSKRYGSRIALDGITLDVADDSYVSLLGASGSGKTVLLRAIAGFEPLDGGTIALRGEPLSDRPAHRRNIGFVFQNFALFPHLTVQQNIAFGLENRAADRPSARLVAERVRAMVDLVGLSGLESRAVTAISGGQRQRVALARTLVAEPTLVLLDEPLGALDANLRARMCGELRRIRERLGVTFLHVTGSETEALAMGDEVVVLDAGRIAQIGAPDTVYGRPADAAVAKFLNCYNMFAGRPGPASFETEGARLPVRGMPEPRSGAVYAIRHDLIAVRPIDAAVEEAEARLTGDFLASEYSGPAVTSFFRLPSGTVVTVEDHLSHREPQLFEPGRAYGLVWRAADALVLPAREASRA
ncbi:ABC transporter ATP-binding protein [Lichenibacterium ramalinae]|uniref:ABC transporter ATP-binding protein n=1 Tax=Lichenibacterium ramalinae TaxID=2316527 RepID=UPI001FE2413C|nr:ABC transporter ATP-binding protein [Lichenibacterium ramalinae]